MRQQGKLPMCRRQHMIFWGTQFFWVTWRQDCINKSVWCISLSEVPALLQKQMLCARRFGFSPFIHVSCKVTRLLISDLLFSNKSNVPACHNAVLHTHTPSSWEECDRAMLHCRFQWAALEWWNNTQIIHRGL